MQLKVTKTNTRLYKISIPELLIRKFLFKNMIKCKIKNK